MKSIVCLLPNEYDRLIISLERCLYSHLNKPQKICLFIFTMACFFTLILTTFSEANVGPKCVAYFVNDCDSSNPPMTPPAPSEIAPEIDIRVSIVRIASVLLYGWRQSSLTSNNCYSLIVLCLRSASVVIDRLSWAQLFLSCHWTALENGLVDQIVANT